MTTSSLPNRIATLGIPSDYPQPAFQRACAEQVDFAIAICPHGHVRVVKDRQGVTPRPPTLEELLSCTLVRPDQARALLGEDQHASPRDGDGSADYAPTEAQERFHGGWRGTPPAEGTRRRTILDAVKRVTVRLGNGVGGYVTERSALDLADEIESCLLRDTIEAEAEELPEPMREHAVAALTDDAEPVEDDEEVWDVATDPEGRPYVALDKLTDFLLDLESEIKQQQNGEEAEAPDEAPDEGRAFVTGQRSGKREAMLRVIREQAATEADAEAVVDSLERNGRAFMLDGRHLPEPGEVVEVEPEESGLFDRPPLLDLFLSMIPGRRRG